VAKAATDLHGSSRIDHEEVYTGAARLLGQNIKDDRRPWIAPVIEQGMSYP